MFPLKLKLRAMKQEKKTKDEKIAPEIVQVILLAVHKRIEIKKGVTYANSSRRKDAFVLYDSRRRKTECFGFDYNGKNLKSTPIN